MKVLLFLIAIVFVSLTSFSQNILSVHASQTVSKSYPRLVTNVKLDAFAYAVVISIDAEWGFLKQKGDAYDGVMIQTTTDASKTFNVSGLTVGTHKVYFTIYSNPRTVVDRREVIFEVTE